VPHNVAALAAVEPRELSQRQLMAVHGLLELRHRDTRLEFQAGVEGKQAEDVAMEVGDAPTGTVAGAVGKLGCPIQAGRQTLVLRASAAAGRDSGHCCSTSFGLGLHSLSRCRVFSR